MESVWFLGLALLLIVAINLLQRVENARVLREVVKISADDAVALAQKVAEENHWPAEFQQTNLKFTAHDSFPGSGPTWQITWEWWESGWPSLHCSPRYIWIDAVSGEVLKIQTERDFSGCTVTYERPGQFPRRSLRAYP